MAHLSVKQQQPIAPRLIAEAALARLRKSPYPPVRGVRCRFDSGRLVLRGRTQTFFHKQMAQEAVAGLDGVRQVVNRIRVA